MHHVSTWCTSLIKRWHEQTAPRRSRPFASQRSHTQTSGATPEGHSEAMRARRRTHSGPSCCLRSYCAYVNALSVWLKSHMTLWCAPTDWSNWSSPCHHVLRDLIFLFLIKMNTLIVTELNYKPGPSALHVLTDTREQKLLIHTGDVVTSPVWLAHLA